MKTGIEEIAEERAEQISKYGYTQDRDIMYVDGQLLDAAVSIATDSPAHWPWSPALLVHYKNRNQIDKLRIAGALLAAEIDRLKSLEEVEELKPPVREAILDSITDLVSNFTYYDRKEDQELTEAKLDEAIRTGVIALDEIVDHFKKELEKAYENT